VADPATRNIYTYLPDGSGGGSVVAFSTANAAALTTALGVSDAAAFIESVRAQPLGAVIGSTPALMDAPSLDPPPDTDYGFPDSVGTFAGDHKDRRSILFFGANDGMIHAIDARTGYEVWAFIPYNLLPKLKTLRDGQPVEQFDFFVDSSPKIAEVKLNGSSCTGFGVTSPCWRSLLIMGEGPGGTFYQTFDVTEAGMGVSQTADGLSAVSAMLAKFDSPNESIAFKWAFPNYSSFDPAYSATFSVADGTSGGKVKLYGDLKSRADYAEKTVGFTWSDPAVGPLDSTRTTNAVIVGSGYFPDIETLIPARASGPKAGNALYLLDADTGKPIGNTSGATCTTIASGSGSGSGCINIGDVSNGRKNALQADPTAAGTNGSFVVNRAYLGDTDGKYWRFTLTPTGSVSALTMTDTGQPIYASSALLFVGSADVYTFFATGSDLLPVTAPGGTGTFKLYGLKDNYPSAATVQFSRNLSAVTNVSGLANGERASAAPSVAGDIVFYTTTVETANTPCADFSANLYAVTYTGTAAYDSDGNGKLDKSESPVAATMAGRATAPFIVDQHLYFGTTGAGGANLESFGDPADFNNGIGQVGVRILSWREIR
jgi:Tfp pilus tip-associated adhesin PilY1